MNRIFEIIQYKENGVKKDAYGIFWDRSIFGKDGRVGSLYSLNIKEMAELRDVLNAYIIAQNQQPKEEGE